MCPGWCSPARAPGGASPRAASPRTRSARRDGSASWTRHEPLPFPRRALFGSDYPVISPDRRLAVAKLDIKPEVRPKILKRNAARLLGLAPGPS
ncbi:amidohydrolase family protein [Nonomuraea wenchangensis]